MLRPAGERGGKTTTIEIIERLMPATSARSVQACSWTIRDSQPDRDLLQETRLSEKLVGDARSRCSAALSRRIEWDEATAVVGSNNKCGSENFPAASA